MRSELIDELVRCCWEFELDFGYGRVWWDVSEIVGGFVNGMVRGID